MIYAIIIFVSSIYVLRVLIAYLRGTQESRLDRMNKFGMFIFIYLILFIIVYDKAIEFIRLIKVGGL